MPMIQRVSGNQSVRTFGWAVPRFWGDLVTIRLVRAGKIELAHLLEIIISLGGGMIHEQRIARVERSQIVKITVQFF